MQADADMDIAFFIEMLNIDSTSGREAGFADFLTGRLAGPERKVETFDVGDGTRNILVSWGSPKVFFCSHLDTVPPYFPPVMDGDIIRGRGSCDAKGQIFAMYEACKALEAKGHTDFALLLLAGEETGSHGAKAFNSILDKTLIEDDRVVNKVSSDTATGPCICESKYGKGNRSPVPLRAVVEDDRVVIVGEPTDNCMASAAKGTKSFEVTFTGSPCHSGYPENGQSAVMYFNDFIDALRSIVFPSDPVLGETTWNIGKLISDNPQNILSGHLTCRVYFRTTFESDEMVCNVMKNIAGPQAKLRFGKRTVQDGSDIVGKEVAPWQKAMSVRAFGGDTPTRFETFEDFPAKPVAFGSDAPQLTCFKRRILCGPGSILTAHRNEEFIDVHELEEAVDNFVRMYEIIKENNI